MSPRTARRVLWLAALALVPLPMLVFDEQVPVVRYLVFAAVCVGMRIAEGPGGVVWELTALFLSHALVYAALLYVGARLVVRVLGPMSAPVRAAVVAVVVAGAAAWALLGEPYATPFGTTARANLLGVLR